MENTVKKTRMRTLNQTLKLLRKIDPDTSITYHFLRVLCDKNEITIVRAGKKYLINFDELLKYLNIEE